MEQGHTSPLRVQGDVPKAKYLFLYRLSSGGYTKVKPAFITKETCLANFCACIQGFCKGKAPTDVALVCIADNCQQPLFDTAQATFGSVLAPSQLSMLRTWAGNGAASFRLALDIVAKAANPSAVVYMVEDDYLHTGPEAFEAIFDGL